MLLGFQPGGKGSAKVICWLISNDHRLYSINVGNFHRYYDVSFDSISPFPLNVNYTGCSFVASKNVESTAKLKECFFELCNNVKQNSNPIEVQIKINDILSQIYEECLFGDIKIPTEILKNIYNCKSINELQKLNFDQYNKVLLNNLDVLLGIFLKKCFNNMVLLTNKAEKETYKDLSRLSKIMVVVLGRYEAQNKLQAAINDSKYTNEEGKKNNPSLSAVINLMKNNDKESVDYHPYELTLDIWLYFIFNFKSYGDMTKSVI